MRLARAVSAGILLIGSLLLLVFVLQDAVAQGDKPGEPAVELKVVKYSQLVESVKAQRGKVVLVDVWADW